MRQWFFVIIIIFRDINRSVVSAAYYIVQSLNSPFREPYKGVEPWRAKRESRITCMRMLKTNQSELWKNARASVSSAVDGVVHAQDFVI